MLRRYWSKHYQAIRWVAASIAALSVAVALLLIGTYLGVSSGYYEAQANGYATQNQAETEERVKDCLAKVPVTRAQECAEEAITAGREDQRDEQDLSAQRQMAKWAYWLLLFTVAQSLLGIFGFIALIITIRQGREANELARISSQAGLRAYFSPKAVNLSLVKKTSASCNFEVVFWNSGQTPAKMVFRHISGRYFSPRTIPVIMGGGATKWRENGETTTNVEQLIGPGGTTSIPFPTAIPLVDFDHTGPRRGPLHRSHQTVIEIEIEWAYLDYLGRRWTQNAVYTTPNIEWADPFDPLEIVLTQVKAGEILQISSPRQRGEHYGFWDRKRGPKNSQAL